MGRISDFIADFRSISFCKEANEKNKLGKRYLPANVVSAGDITKSAGDNYIVRSQSHPGVTYEINPHNCTCTCPAGQCGAICKHMVGVHFHTEATLFSFPPCTEDMRNKYHMIAYGDQPPPGYYSSLNNMNKLPTVSVAYAPLPSTSHADNTGGNLNDLPEPSTSHAENTGSQQSATENSLDQMVMDEVKNMLPAFHSDQENKDVRNLLRQVIKTMSLRRKTSRNSFLQLKHEWLSRQGKKTRRTRIHTNPASITRRATGVSRGKEAAKKGRKRKRCLQYNVDRNQANATKH